MLRQNVYGPVQPRTAVVRVQTVIPTSSAAKNPVAAKLVWSVPMYICIPTSSECGQDVRRRRHVDSLDSNNATLTAAGGKCTDELPP